MRIVKKNRDKNREMNREIQKTRFGVLQKKNLKNKILKFEI